MLELNPPILFNAVTIVDTLREPLLVLSADLRCESPVRSSIQKRSDIV